MLSYVMRVLSLVIIGPTNAGKSTLINYLMKRHIVCTAQRANSSRSVVLGVINRGDVQIRLYDTPGLGSNGKLASLYGKTSAIIKQEKDFLLLLDGLKTYIPNCIKKYLPENKNIFVVFNKIDKGKKHLLSLNDKMRAQFPFIEKNPENFFEYISAKTGDGVEILLDRLCKRAKPGKFWETVKNTSQRPEDLAKEALRGALFFCLKEELPYSLGVSALVIEKEIYYKISCKRASQRGIILGHLRGIYKRTRYLLKKFFPGDSLEVNINVVVGKNR
jgi:GTP-binding protein Era